MILINLLTFVFTKEGKIIVRKDKEGKIDTFPWLFIGRCEKDSKIDYEDSVWVMNNIDVYKETIVLRKKNKGKIELTCRNPKGSVVTNGFLFWCLFIQISNNFKTLDVKMRCL